MNQKRSLVEKILVFCYDLATVVGKIWYPLLLTAVFMVAMLMTDQAQDFFVTIMENKTWWNAITFSLWALFFSIVVCSCARTILWFRDVKMYDEQQQERKIREDLPIVEEIQVKHNEVVFRYTNLRFVWFLHWATFALGASVWFISMFAMYRGGNGMSARLCVLNALGISIYYFSIQFLGAVLEGRKDYDVKKVSRAQAFLASTRLVEWLKSFLKTDIKIDQSRKAFKNMSPKVRYFIYFILGFSVFWVLFCTICPQWLPAMNTANVVTSALSTYMVLGTAIQYLSIRKDSIKISIMSLLVAWMAFCSKYNDNHRLYWCYVDAQTQQEVDGRRQSALVDARPSAPLHFKKWISAKLAQHPTDTVPVVIFAHEGGGIRGLAWSGLLMNGLVQRLGERFYSNVFAVTGASGGGVGSLFYHVYHHDRFPKNDSAWFHFLSNDYFAQLTVSMLYGDLLARALPFPLHGLDRARALEGSWIEAYECNFGENTLAHSFLGLFADDSLHTPSFFINSTIVETGNRAVTSNLKLEPQDFPKIVDLLGYSGADLRVATAALNYARFPFITPAGLVWDREEKNAFHIVDAGYYDNYGLQTAYDVYTMMQRAVATDPALSPLAPRIQYIVVLVKNSPPEPTNVPRVTMWGEASNVLKGAYNSLYGDDEFTRTLFKRLDEEPGSHLKYMEFRLGFPDSIILPMSWSMSRVAAQWIKDRVDATFEPSSKGHDEDVGNRGNYEWLVKAMRY